MPGRCDHMFVLSLSSVTRKLTVTQASYKPPPPSNPVYPSLSLSEARGVTSDGRPRSSRQRVFLTKSRLEVPASDREKILFDVPVPQVGLPEIQPETEHTVLFATTVTTMPRHEVCYSLTDALARRRLTEPSAPAFGNLKIDGKSHLVWHLSVSRLGSHWRWMLNLNPCFSGQDIIREGPLPSLLKMWVVPAKTLRSLWLVM